ncbi:uncharacterized protein [Euwallacea fornicatus]|uniref:uncharacterized protein n=1 Tax=Euwallacea fornicatus TaxID=995702 RepID=UPI00338FC7B1
MEPQPFTTLEVENLQRLIDRNAEDNLIKDELIDDSDILFFSQYGHLQGAEDDSNIQLLQGVDDVNGKTLERRNTSIAQPPKDVPSALSQPKYKEQDGKSIRVFECGLCGKEFGHQYTLMRHLPTHTDERKFHCLTCGKSFRQMSTLSQHRTIHSSARPYVCQICNKNFNRVSTLISHTKTHTGLKPHRCHLCDKAFHQKGNLRNHIFTHTNERPYKCGVCGKGFNQMSNLMCHKTKIHQNQSDVVLRYLCKICGLEFGKRINLRQHEQYKHGLIVSTERPMEVSIDTEGTSKLDIDRDYAKAIIVDPINTDAMKLALSTGNIPFSLLRPLSGIPVLVRVIPVGDKQMLVPATAEDLKKYGHISVRPKVRDVGEDKENEANKGCVVQIKVPVVATVIQKCNATNENMSMNAVSLEHGEILDETGAHIGELTGDSFVYSPTLIDEIPEVQNKVTEGVEVNFGFDEKFDHVMGTINNEVDKNSDISAMEFNFEIPQDAREVPAPGGAIFSAIDSQVERNES